MGDDLTTTIDRIGAYRRFSPADFGVYGAWEHVSYEPQVIYASKYWSLHMKHVPPETATALLKNLTPALQSFCRARVITLWVELLHMLKARDLITESLDFAIAWWSPISSNFPDDRGMNDVMQALRITVALARWVKDNERNHIPDAYFHFPRTPDSRAVVLFTNKRMASHTAVDNFDGLFVMRVDFGLLLPQFAPTELPYDYACALVVSVSGDGTCVAAACGASIIIWDGGNDTHPAQVAMPEGRTVEEMQLSFNGVYLLAMGAGQAEISWYRPFSVFVRQDDQWRLSHTWDEFHCYKIRPGAISSDGRSIVVFLASPPSVSVDLTTIWTRKAKSRVASHEPGRNHPYMTYHISGDYTTAVFSPDSRTLALSWRETKHPWKFTYRDTWTVLPEGRLNIESPLTLHDAPFGSL